MVVYLKPTIHFNINEYSSWFSNHFSCACFFFAFLLLNSWMSTRAQRREEVRLVTHRCITTSQPINLEIPARIVCRVNHTFKVRNQQIRASKSHTFQCTVNIFIIWPCVTNPELSSRSFSFKPTIHFNINKYNSWFSNHFSCVSFFFASNRSQISTRAQWSNQLTGKFTDKINGSQVNTPWSSEIPAYCCLASPRARYNTAEPKIRYFYTIQPRIPYNQLGLRCKHRKPVSFPNQPELNMGMGQ